MICGLCNKEHPRHIISLGGPHCGDDDIIVRRNDNFPYFWLGIERIYLHKRDSNPYNRFHII